MLQQRDKFVLSSEALQSQGDRCNQGRTPTDRQRSFQQNWAVFGLAPGGPWVRLAAGCMSLPMPAFKRVMIWAAVGAAFGFILWSIIGKYVISAVFGSVGGSVTCGPDVEAALGQFVRWGMYSALAGAVGVPIAAWSVARSRAKSAGVANNVGGSAAR